MKILKPNKYSWNFLIWWKSNWTDKQQEVDVESPQQAPSTSGNPTRTRSPRTMSQISGFKRPLMHTNSFTSDKLPCYGVETSHEPALGAMLCDINTWGIDIFKIGTLSCNRPLTCVAYQIFQVSKMEWTFHQMKVIGREKWTAAAVRVSIFLLPFLESKSHYYLYDYSSHYDMWISLSKLNEKHVFCSNVHLP